MINFEEVKTRIAEITGAAVEDVQIGFLTKVYEITFAKELEKEIDREKAMDIVTAVADGVVRTIDYIGFDAKSVVVVFHM